MTRYVITIAPDVVGKPDAATAQTTVRVDTSTGDARITELTVRAPSGGGIAPGDLPAFDLDLLIRAVTAPSTIRALPAGESHTGGRGPDSSEVDEHSAAAQPVATSETAAADTGPFIEEPAETAGAAAGGAAPEPTGAARAGATPRKATAKKAAAQKTAAKKAPAARKATTARKAAATKMAGRKAAATGAKATGRSTAGAKATGGAAARAKAAKATSDRDGVRAYRRMPDPAEVLAAYAQSGSITGLAQHYGVPRHTANGWARRLRQQGHAIGRK